MQLSRQYWSGLPFPSLGVSLTQGMNLGLLSLQVDSLMFESTREANSKYNKLFFFLLTNIRLTSLGVTGSRFIHLSTADSHLFLLMKVHCAYVHMHHNFLIHSFVNGHLGCFHILAIVNSAATNIRVYVTFWTMIFSRYLLSIPGF